MNIFLFYSIYVSIKVSIGCIIATVWIIHILSNKPQCVEHFVVYNLGLLRSPLMAKLHMFHLSEGNTNADYYCWICPGRVFEPLQWYLKEIPKKIIPAIEPPLSGFPCVFSQSEKYWKERQMLCLLWKNFLYRFKTFNKDFFSLLL